MTGSPLPRITISAVCPVCGGQVEPTNDCGCLALLNSFQALMESELRANVDKGGRSAWRTDQPYALLAEVHDHAAKLHIAVREIERRRSGRPARPVPWGGRPLESLIREFAADTANMALMLLDSLGLLDEIPLPADRQRAALEQLDGHVGQREQAIITQTLRPPAPADQQGAS